MSKLCDVMNALDGVVAKPYPLIDPRGCSRCMPMQLRVPILLFWHTKFMKYSYVRSWHPTTRLAPPMVNPWPITNTLCQTTPSVRFGYESHSLSIPKVQDFWSMHLFEMERIHFAGTSTTKKIWSLLKLLTGGEDDVEKIPVQQDNSGFLYCLLNISKVFP